jgi:hypothetical protein
LRTCSPIDHEVNVERAARSKHRSAPARSNQPEDRIATHDRFPRTHVGSLPRNEELIQIMFAREDGIALDKAALETKIIEAVESVAARQIEAGLDIINDGEMPKPSYATYVKDRLNGFGGPATASRSPTSRRSRTSRPACSPIPAANIARRRRATARSACAMSRPRAATLTGRRNRGRSEQPSPADHDEHAETAVAFSFAYAARENIAPVSAGSADGYVRIAH